ncbi:hypothetical protein [Agrococcus jenensis]|uniref:PknH-like protein n=1 Tax=Agrococcus jenensis TaxID=46353 RepID=A0A3N2AQ19_9MICO|nr:hypothetical protein [Agrococcus jenensis]ROR65086.1 hypothetical protein EDD26_0445 [Agrococcus jenensis]
MRLVGACALVVVAALGLTGCQASGSATPAPLATPEASRSAAPEAASPSASAQTFDTYVSGLVLAAEDFPIQGWEPIERDTGGDWPTTAVPCALDVEPLLGDVYLERDGDLGSQAGQVYSTAPATSPLTAATVHVYMTETAVDGVRAAQEAVAACPLDVVGPSNSYGPVTLTEPAAHIDAGEASFCASASVDHFQYGLMTETSCWAAVPGHRLEVLVSAPAGAPVPAVDVQAIIDAAADRAFPG